MPEEATTAPTESQNQSPIPKLEGAKPSDPTTAMQKAQEAITAKQPFGFDEIDILAGKTAKPPEPKPKPAPKKEARKPKDDGLKHVATGKPQSEPPDRPVEEADPLDLTNMKPEEYVSEFMNPSPEDAARQKADQKTGDDEDETDPLLEGMDEEDKLDPEIDPDIQAEVEEKGKKSKINELRHAYVSLKKELRAAKEEAEKIKATPPEDPEKQTLVETIEQTKKRVNDLEDELRYANYQRSDEYNTKYSQPIVNAFKAAYEDIGSMEIGEKRDDVGDIIEKGREATPEDFNILLRMNATEAAKTARALFGDTAPEVLHHRRKILDLKSQGDSALEEFKAKGSEREAQRLEVQTKQKAELKKLWDNTSREIAEKYGHFFKSVDGDEESNTLLKRGYAVTDYALSNPNIPPEQVVKMHAMMRHKAAAFDSVVNRYRKELQSSKERIAELEGEVDQYKGSEPGAGEPRGRNVESAASDFADEIDSLARMNR